MQSLEENQLPENSKLTKKVKGEIRVEYKSSKMPKNFKQIKESIKEFESEFGNLDEESNTYFLCSIDLSTTNETLDAKIDMYFFSFKVKPASTFDLVDIQALDNDLSDPNMEVIKNHYDSLEENMKKIICSLL